jgi:hypothetical protein
MKPFGLLLTVVLSIVLLGFATPQSLWAQPKFNVENPRDGSIQSGKGMISGWICTATKIELIADERFRVQAPYGIQRIDTQSVCGDDNNGFGFEINWNDLGDGLHTIQFLADGVEFARVIVTVQTLGVEFLRGASGGTTFSFNGCAVTVQWEESVQNFVIVDMSTCLSNLLGRWEFITTTSTGSLSNHYLLQQVGTQTDDELGVSLEEAIGTDLDSGGQAAVLKYFDLLPAFTVDAAPYEFALAAQSSSACRVFFFDQDDANTVSGVGTSIPLDATGACQPPSSAAGLTFSPMAGTKTGTALSESRSDRVTAPKHPQVHAQIGTEAIRRALRMLSRIK